MQTLMLLLTAVLIAIMLGFSGCAADVFKNKMRQSRIAAAEDVIKEKPEFRETDNICKQIPPPEGTKFIEKARVYNWVGLSYYYYSDKAPKDLDEFFEDYLLKQEWRPVKPDSIQQTVDFKNDKFRVTVTLTGITGDSNFSIHCEKLNTGRDE